MLKLHRLVVAITIACPTPASVAAQDIRPAATVPELIRALDAEKFRDRQAAQRALAARDDADTELRQALRTLGAEGQRRAKAILEASAERQTNRFVRYARNGRIDLLAQWSASAGEWIKPESL